jgi:hypothetical protein
MTGNRRTQGHFRQWSTAAMLAAIFGVAELSSAHADDGAVTATGVGLSAASSGSEYDPAVFDYSSDPSNLFSPVYTIQPTGPAKTSLFPASAFRWTLFSGSVDYIPLSGLAGEPGGYSETITTVGAPGPCCPSPSASGR